MTQSVPRAPAGPAHAGAGRRLYLLFRIGADRYALDAADIAEVLGLRVFKQVPGAPHWVAGMMERRGAAVPVLDMSALAGAGAAACVTSTRLAMVRYRADALAGERLLGLILEQATETVHYDPAAFQPHALDNAEARYLGPVLSDALGMVQSVRVDDLLPLHVRSLLFPPASGAASGEALP
ncbi:chemotaxis protein CheW [Achromobacter arsenitoxydans]|uniref:Chemotaxis protein CheW n=1 Tax=Achromobacter arsenitoxydans SY8 TaxID=477184 RepID=H0F0Z3_9BURK|nr:chemotaxis protein CheW [Achromobacter arsenitoxydans]EHK68031.1 chemotaxis protein CheW [Achromobacter arsenitoxydans SY8]